MKRNAYPGLIRRAVWALILAGTTCSGGIAQEPNAPVTEEGTQSSDFDREVYLESFDVVWDTIHESHWDRELVGDPWKKTGDRLRPKMEKAESRKEAVEILNELIGSLEQSHFGIIPSKAYRKIEQQEKRGGPGYSGITVRCIADEMVITHVAKGSPAEEVQIQPGWSIVKSKAGTREVTSQQLFEEANEASEHAVFRADTAKSLAGASLVSGKIGDTLELTVIDDKGEQASFTMDLIKGPGEPEKLMKLPTTYVTFDVVPLPDGVAQVKFNAFLKPVKIINGFQEAMKSKISENGMVIYLRGNMGGLMILTMGMAGWLVDEPIALGTMTLRNTPLKLRLNPRKPMYDKPVAVLIDEVSISAAEVLAGGLQDLGVARVFGSKTAGLVLPSAITKLPSGDGFQYAMANYESASGRVLEIDGVVPDEKIELTKEQLQGGGDPVLDAALKWIKSQPEK